MSGAARPALDRRPWTFYVLTGLFVSYVLALYGPMLCIYVLSFQDVRGGLVFPMKGFSLHWFVDLFTQVRTGDVKGAFERSIRLAAMVTVITVVVSFLAGMAFRRRFRGDSVVFYLMIGSLVAPGLVLGIGIGLLFQYFGLEPSWYTSALGAQLSLTLPFGVLVMFAVMSRFDRRWEENPAHDTYYPKSGDKKVAYTEGVFVGYRGYDKSGVKPLFPFAAKSP